MPYTSLSLALALSEFSPEPMFSVQNWMSRRPRKKVRSLEVLIGISVDVYKNALISYLKLLSSHPLVI